MTAPVGRMVLVALALMAMLLLPGTTAAQAPGTPAPAATALPMVGSGDSRSDGEGPGIVGSPLAIAAGVVALGLLTAVGTVLVSRLAGSRRGGA